MLHVCNLSFSLSRTEREYIYVRGGRKQSLTEARCLGRSFALLGATGTHSAGGARALRMVADFGLLHFWRKSRAGGLWWNEIEENERKKFVIDVEFWLG